MLPIARSVASSSSIFWFIDNDIIQFIVIPRELSRSWRSAAHDAITGIHFSLKSISLINRCVLKTPWVAIWYLRNLRLGSGCLLAWARFIHPTIYDTLRILNDDASVRYLASARFRTEHRTHRGGHFHELYFFSTYLKIKETEISTYSVFTPCRKGRP